MYTQNQTFRNFDPDRTAQVARSLTKNLIPSRMTWNGLNRMHKRASSYTKTVRYVHERDLPQIASNQVKRSHTSPVSRVLHSTLTVENVEISCRVSVFVNQSNLAFRRRVLKLSLLVPGFRTAARHGIHCHISFYR